MIVDKSKLKEGDIIYENKYQAIKVINPEYPFTFMKCNGVVILPFDAYDNLYVLKTNRPNIGEYYELPRGIIENGEDFVEGAKRELEEETGLKVLETWDLGNIQPDTGLLRHQVKLIGIMVERKEEDFYTKYDDADKVTFKIYKKRLEDLYSMILDGGITCGYTMSSISKFMSLRCKDLGLRDDGCHNNVKFLTDKALNLIPFSQREYLKGRNDLEKILYYFINMMED